MTQDEIITMARESGITFKPMVIEGVEYEYRYVECNDNIGGDEAGCIERFAALVAAKEREACIKLIEPSSEHRSDPSGYLGEHQGVELLDALCEAIRARGNP